MAELKVISTDYIATYFPDRSALDLTKLQDRLNKLVANYLRTSFIVAQYTETIDSKPVLIPSHLPIASVTSITDLSVAATEFVENTNYFVYTDRINLPGRLYGSKDITISYSAGLTELDPMVELVGEELIRFWAFKEGKTDELFLAKEDMEDRSYTNKEITEATILSRLRRYRNSPLGSRNGGTVRIGVI